MILEKIVGISKPILLLFIGVFFVSSCSCSSVGGNLTGVGDQDGNAGNDGGTVDDSEEIVVADVHSPAFAKDVSGNLLIHEKLSSYEQNNPIFTRKVLGLVVRPDTLDRLSFTVEDRSVQVDDGREAIAVRVDSIVPLGNFSCLEASKKLTCGIDGMDAISREKNEMRVKLEDIEDSSTIIVLSERSALIDSIEPYLVVKSSRGIYNIRTGVGNLPAGYSIAPISEPGTLKSFIVVTDSKATEKVEFFLTHSYHYHDLGMIDLNPMAKITLDFSDIMENGKIVCEVFDENVGEKSGYACVYDPKIVGTGESLDLTFSNTYTTADPMHNGKYRINY